MAELIPVFVLILIIVYQGVFIFLQKKDFSRREQDLLNRIMSRSYETYVQGEKLMEPPRPLTPEEIYEMEQERGIPV